MDEPQLNLCNLQEPMIQDLESQQSLGIASGSWKSSD